MISYVKSLPLRRLQTLIGMVALKAPASRARWVTYYVLQEILVHSWGKNTKAVRRLFQKGRLLKEINNSLIAHIPKIESSSSFYLFRLISLCNVNTKSLQNQKGLQIKTFITETGITMVHVNLHSYQIDGWEILRWLYRKFFIVSKKEGIGGFMAIKVDLQKAYDRLNWTLLNVILKLQEAGNWEGLGCVFMCVRM